LKNNKILYLLALLLIVIWFVQVLFYDASMWMHSLLLLAAILVLVTVYWRKAE